MGKLEINLGSLPLLALDLHGGTTTLGHSQDNDIVLPLPEVAEHHAEIDCASGMVRIRALGEERLTVRGRFVAEATLGHGDAIGIGGYRLEWFEDDDAAGRTAGHGTKPIRTLPLADETRVSLLRVLTGPKAGRDLRLADRLTTVGRSPECDLVLSDDAVSWRHACIEPLETGVRVRDLDSRNGTFLDGRRIESAVATAGSRISVGHTLIELLPAASGRETDQAAGLVEMVGSSEVMRRVYSRIRELAQSKVPVLIEGETGTGKELAARALHVLGPRSAGSFVPVNCAAIPREIMEDELFGHVRGAFTGASADRQGAFERADGGTIFLDEIGQLPPDLQAKLLRVVEDGEVARLGGSPVRCDFRVLAATNTELADGVAGGRFRQDLYFRIAVERLRMPRLTQRLEDLPDLVRAFLATAEERWGIVDARHIRIDPAALEVLERHPWPGHVRELRNVVLRAAARVSGGLIDADLIADLLGETALPDVADAGATTFSEAERQVVERALNDCNGQRRAAARRLGIAESTLYEKIKRHGLEKVGRP